MLTNEKKPLLLARTKPIPMPRKILVVDDQQDILLVLEREFRKVPELTATSCTNFSEALGLLARKQFDLVISDVRLGKESGFDLVREINRSHPGTASILMTAYRSPINRQEAEQLGVILFLEKPFQISRLIEEIKNYFHQSSYPAAAEIEAPKSSDELNSRRSAALTHFELRDLVQLFCLNGRNILITVRPRQAQPGSVGEIYIQRGKVIHADFAGQSGSTAFRDLMLLRQPLLKIKDWAAPVPVTIESSWEHLILQSAIDLDHQDDGIKMSVDDGLRLKSSGT